MNDTQNINTANAIITANELATYVLQVYQEVTAIDIGYQLLLSTMPTKVDEETFQKAIEIAGKVDSKFRMTADQIQVALRILRDLHTTHPTSEAYSLIALTGDMLNSRHILLDDPEL